MNRCRTTTAGVVCIGGLVAAGTALAQEAAPGALEEIVVTAEKRESTIQNTPISITAFSGEELAKSGIDGTGALANYTPGLTVQKEVIGKVVIRGVGTENYTVGSDPGVAIHKDGVYVARSSVAIFDFFDVNRVEVLRGPQGTLYGRNATGGVINILSNEPTAEFGGSAKLDVGNYDKQRIEAVLNGAFSDNVQGRLSVLYAQRDGFSENVYPGLPAVPEGEAWSGTVPAISSAKKRGVDQLDNQDLTAARGQLKFLLGDSVDLLLSAEILRDDSMPPAFKYFDTSNAYWFGAFGPDQDIKDPRRVSQGFESEIPGTNRKVPALGNADQDSYLARLTWDLGGMTFTSLTGYRKIDFSWLNDGDGFDTFFVNYFQTDESKQLTQEFQLTSSDPDARLKWILGAYYLDEQAETFMGIPFLYVANFINPDAPYLTWDGESNTTAYAVFGQATWSFTDDFRITAGLRYNQEDKNGFLIYDPFGFNPDRQKQKLDDSWDAVTPKLALEYDFTNDVMGYASITRGFKSGGFNLLAAQEPYDPEYLWSYELGVKSKLAGGRVIANVGAFYYDYSDMQVGKVVNLSATVVNAAAATIMGAEAELRALVTDRLEVNVGLSWLDTEYDKFETEDPAWPGDAGCGKLVAEPRTISLAGCELPRAPEFQAVAGASWTQPLSNGGDVNLRADLSYRSDQYFTQFNRDIVSQDGYTLLGARATYTAPDSRWYVTAYGDNLTDEEYFVTVLESGVAAPGTVVPQAVYGAPRTYGVVIGVNF